MTDTVASNVTPPGSKRLYLGLGIGSALIYLAFLAPGVYTIDGNAMLAVAQSIVLHHSLAVNPSLGELGLHGKYYSLWYPLLSFVAVPFVAFGAILAHALHLSVHYCAALLAMVLQILIVATTVSLVGALALRLGADWQGARLAALVFGFGTIAPTYSRTFFAEPLLGLMTVLAVYLGFTAKPKSTGIVSALAVLAKPPTVFVGPVLSLYEWGKEKKWRWMIPGMGAFIGGLLFLAYNVLRFGRPLFLSANPGGALRLSVFPVGLVGLLFSPGFGLIWFCPVVIVAATAGLSAGMKKRPRETLAIIFIGLAYLTLYASWSVWMGGWSWGPRLLFPILPIFLALIGIVGRRWRKVVLVLAAFGFLVSAPTWVCFFERAFAESLARRVPQSAMVWSVSESPLVRMWPAALHEIQDAVKTNPRMLIAQAEQTHHPAGTIEQSRALRVVAIWWWVLPAVGIPRWIGAMISLVLIGAGLFVLSVWTSPEQAASLTPAETLD